MLSSQSQRTIKNKIVAKKFAAEYLANGENGKRAYMAIKPQAKENTATTEAGRLLRKPDVVNEIAKLMPSDSMIGEQITTAILQQPDDKINWTQKHSFITTALRLKGYLKDKQQGDVNIALVID